MISRRKSFGSPSFFFPFFVSDLDDDCDGSDLYDLGCIWFWKNLRVMKNTWVFLIFLDFSLCLIWKILEREKFRVCVLQWLNSDFFSDPLLQCINDSIYIWKLGLLCCREMTKMPLRDLVQKDWTWTKEKTFKKKRLTK